MAPDDDTLDRSSSVDPPLDPTTPSAESAVPEAPIPSPTAGTRPAWTPVTLVVALVVAVGALGFVTGHYVDGPSSSSQASITYPSLPSYGNGGSAGITLPNFPGYARTTPAQSRANAKAEKVATSVDPGLVDVTSTFAVQGTDAEGTGMILTKDGLVLTNNHVIEGASSITARDVATGTTYDATVVGYDVSADVALLQLTNATGLETVTTGDSNKVTSGIDIVGIGNAGGVGGTPSYAAGTVTGLNQSITASDESNPAGAEKLSNLIEINADIEPGDSGGPLVNAKGKVIGMDTAGSQANGGFGYESNGAVTSRGYAIPINTALAVAKSIENNEATSTIHVGATAFLGVEIDGSANLGNAATVTGVTIAQVIAHEPAAGVGLAAGDVITSINGTTVTSGTSLQAALLTLRAGQTVIVDYTTVAGTEKSVSVTLTTGPAQ